MELLTGQSSTKRVNLDCHVFHDPRVVEIMNWEWTWINRRLGIIGYVWCPFGWESNPAEIQPRSRCNDPGCLGCTNIPGICFKILGTCWDNYSLHIKFSDTLRKLDSWIAGLCWIAAPMIQTHSNASTSRECQRRWTTWGYKKPLIPSGILT